MHVMARRCSRDLIHFRFSILREISILSLMMNNTRGIDTMTIHTTRDVARLLNTTCDRINVAIHRGKTKGPAVVRGRRLWLPADIRRLATDLGLPLPSALRTQNERAAGLPADIEFRVGN